MKSTKQKFSIKDALLPVYALRNVELLYPESKLMELIKLSDPELEAVWEERCASTYAKLIKWVKEEDWDRISEEFKTKELEVFKKHKDDKDEFRKYSYRSIEKNWVISRFLLENKNDIWVAQGKHKDKISQRTENFQDNISFGYLPAVNDLNKYLEKHLDLKNGGTRIEELKPFVYFNWKWAYELYVRNTLKLNETHQIIKIDLSSAFDNFRYNEKMIPENDEYYRIFSSMNGFTKGGGVKYGFLIESYFLATYHLTDFKYDLHHKLTLSKVENFSISSYVDDNIISYMNVSDKAKIQEILGKYVKSPKESAEENQYIINTDKTTYYSKGSFSSIIEDSYASGTQNFEEMLGENFTYENMVKLPKNLITDRSKEKGKMNALANTIGSFKDYLDKENDILSSKYSYLFYRKYIDMLSPEEVFLFLKNINQKHCTDNGIKRKYKIIGDIIHYKTNSHSKNSSISIFIDKNIMQEQKNSIRELHKTPVLSIFCEYAPPLFSKIDRKEIHEIIRDLMLFTSYIINKKIRKTSSSFTKKLMGEVTRYRTNINYSKISKDIDAWFETEGEWNNNEFCDIDSYMSEFVSSLKRFFIFKYEDTLLYERLSNCLRATSRLEIIQNIFRLAKHIVKYEISEDGGFKPSLHSRVDEVDREMFALLKKYVRKATLSMRKGSTIFAKWDTIVVLRNFLKMSWINGSKELMHFSNHGLSHADNLVKKLSIFTVPFTASGEIKENEFDWFVAIFAIYIHDIGLLDDDVFFSKSGFYKYFATEQHTKREPRKWYIELREKMAHASRQEHGNTSSLLAKKIYDMLGISGYDISSSDFSDALISTILHNGSKSHYAIIEQYNKPIHHIVSLLDIYDMGWERIGRPYINIGTNTATWNTKMFWVKDLLVENIKVGRQVNEPDDGGEIDLNTINITIEIHGSFLKYIINEILQTNNSLNESDEPEITKKFIYMIFKNEIRYIDSKFRKLSGEYSIDSKFGIREQKLSFSLVESDRAFKYSSISLSPSDNDWISEIIESSDFMKKIVSIFDENKMQNNVSKRLDSILSGLLT